MIGNVVVRTGPAAEPVSLAEARLQCKIDDDITTEDSLISGLIAAARARVEAVTNRVMVTQGLRSTFPCFPGGSSVASVLSNSAGGDDRDYVGAGLAFKLRAPLRKVTSITYLDAANVSQTLAATVYNVDANELPGIVSLAYAQVWPTTYYHPAAVSVNFVAGSASPFSAAVDTDIITAVGHPFATGDVVRVMNSGGALPTGLAANTDYYAIGVSGNTLQLSATAGGAAINIAGAGTGTNFLLPADDSEWNAMRTAMLILIESMYRNEEEPAAVAALLGPCKVYGF